MSTPGMHGHSDRSQRVAIVLAIDHGFPLASGYVNTVVKVDHYKLTSWPGTGFRDFSACRSHEHIARALHDEYCDDGPLDHYLPEMRFQHHSNPQIAVCVRCAQMFSTATQRRDVGVAVATR
jgi:hypothetical protein